jgi:hypothetical protein
MQAQAQVKITGYSEEFQRSRVGWGCGYALIPLDHPYMAVIKAEEDLALEPDEEGNIWEWKYYHQPEGFQEEITFDEYVTLNDVQYRQIGFDTAHVYNDAEDDEEWVRNKAQELVDLINNHK